MVWQIEVSDAAKKQLAKMGRVEAKCVTAFLRLRIASLDDPRQLGDALQARAMPGFGATAWGIIASWLIFGIRLSR